MKPQENCLKTSATLKSAALVGAAILLGLTTVQGTLALWNDSAASGTQTVRAAEITVLTKTSTGDTARLTEGTQSITVPGSEGLLPGDSKTTPVLITNASNASSGTFALQVAAGAPQVTGDLAANLTAKIAPSRDNRCEDTSAGQSITLAQGETGAFCLTTTLAQNTPKSLSKKSAVITLVLTARQQ